jgi:hypothetical protein
MPANQILIAGMARSYINPSPDELLTSSCRTRSCGKNHFYVLN